MCTLTLWFRQFPDAPVVVAANRDEDRLRPREDPRTWPDEPAGIFAGRDLVAGGTWLGRNARGVVCGITNRWGPPPDPARGSRGQVVLRTLRAPSAKSAAEVIAGIDPARVNAFGLLVADADDAFRIDCDQARLVVRALAPGIAVLANWAADEQRPRTERAHALAAAVPTGSFTAALPALARLVADHEGAAIPGQAICAHGDRYGTVSSTIVAVGATSRWRDLRGNPCVGVWVERAP